MSVSLTNLLGTELIVGIDPPRNQRTFDGFPGANGLTTMNHGKRGYAVPITGKIRVYGASYAVARTNADAVIATMANYQDLPAADYYFGNTTYYNGIFHDFRILEETNRKAYSRNSDGYIIVKFQITLIGLTN